MRSVHTEASAQDQLRPLAASAPCVALAGTAGACSCFSLSFTHPPSCPPSLGAALLSALLAAHRRCSTMRALTPARRSHAKQVSSLTPLCLPDIPPPTTSCCPTSLCQSPQRVRWVFQASPDPAGSPQHAAETGSSSYGLSVRLRLLSTPPRGDAVTFGYMRCDLPWLRTYTLLAKRTHERTESRQLAQQRSRSIGIMSRSTCPRQPEH